MRSVNGLANTANTGIRWNKSVAGVLSKSRHSVEAAGMPRPAARKPRKSQPESAERTVFPDRLYCVCRTGRIEAARLRQQRCDDALICAQQRDKQRSHRDAAA